MVSSMDKGSISSTPLLDIAPGMIEFLNDSPYDGIALNLMDMRSGQPVSAREDVTPTPEAPPHAHAESDSLSTGHAALRHPE
jgi:hypothetical protein